VGEVVGVGVGDGLGLSVGVGDGEGLGVAPFLKPVITWISFAKDDEVFVLTCLYKSSRRSVISSTTSLAKSAEKVTWVTVKS